MENALRGAQEDLNSGISSKRKNPDVIAPTRMHNPQPTRQLVKNETGNFMEPTSSLVFCVSGDMRVKTPPMTEFVADCSHLRPTEVSLNRVRDFLVYWNREESRYIFLLMTIGRYTDNAKYYDLESCLREMSVHESLKGVSYFALPQNGTVDDRLEWANFAICHSRFFKIFNVP